MPTHELVRDARPDQGQRFGGVNDANGARAGAARQPGGQAGRHRQQVIEEAGVAELLVLTLEDGQHHAKQQEDQAESA